MTLASPLVTGSLSGPDRAHDRMLQRMERVRLTISVDLRVAERVRRCARPETGGASGYLERLVRQDELREAVAAISRWHARHPDQADIDEDERVAAAAELGDCA